MHNIKVNRRVVAETTKLLDLASEFCSPILRIGDIYGPTDAYVIQIDVSDGFIVVDYNNETNWKVGFFQSPDETAVGGFVYNTIYTDTDEFIGFLKTLYQAFE